MPNPIHAQLQECIQCCDDCCDLLKNDPQCGPELAKCEDVKQKLVACCPDEHEEGVRGFDFATLLPLFLQFASILQQILQKKGTQGDGTSPPETVQAAAERGAKGVAGPQSLKRGSGK